MDWSRAKTVLIVSFLLLNVLLGYQLWMDELNLNTFTENAARREEMNRAFAVKDISLEAAVPEGTPELREITVRLERGGKSAPAELPEPFPISLLIDPAYVKSALRAHVLQIDSYEPDPFAIGPGDPIYVLNQLHGDLPMFEMRVELYAQDDSVVAFRYDYSEVQPADPDAPDTAAAPDEPDVPRGQEILSAYTVLESLADMYLPPGADVADVRLGYHGPIFESETQVLAPYWRIVLRTGETYYVHAINGAVEGPSALQE